ncbi:MAG: sigma-70 family RNA polymerase sigma factor [Planctomycetota bacterium]|nr:MAG: sigma-70 family RNA polymerase sigma factor [Planctomycetota bacterium]
MSAIHTTMHQVDTAFLRRLRARDERAWFELWEAFGPVVRGTLYRWGNGRLGEETLRDLTQDTLAALTDSIERFDPQRGVRFSTWLLAIAKHVLGDEMDRRYALKRGAGKRGASLDDSWMGQSREPQPDAIYERRVMSAKVHSAIRCAQKRSEFVHFEAYRLRVLESRSGREIGVLLGVSEPTVTRHCQRVRDVLREELRNAIEQWSFTEDERAEPVRAGLAVEDALFDEALGEIWRAQEEILALDLKAQMAARDRDPKRGQA